MKDLRIKIESSGTKGMGFMKHPAAEAEEVGSKILETGKENLLPKTYWERSKEMAIGTTARGRAL